MPPDSIPAGYRCIACGYDAGGLPGYLCPECAEPVTDEAIVAWTGRCGWQGQWGRLLGRVVAGAAAVCILYSVGLALLMRSGEAGFTALVTLSVMAVVSIGAGLLCSLVAPRGARKVAGAIWLKWMWILHAPWLVTGPGALVVLAIVAGHRVVGLEPDMLMPGFALLAFMFWIALVVTAPVLWIHFAQDDFVTARLLTGPTWALMVLAALGVAVLATAVGGVGGAIAFMAPMDAW